MTFVKIANSAFLLRHLLISMEVLTKKWTPAEFGTQEFFKKRKMINRHSIKILSTSSQVTQSKEIQSFKAKLYFFLKYLYHFLKLIRL